MGLVIKGAECVCMQSALAVIGFGRALCVCVDAATWRCVIRPSQFIAAHLAGCSFNLHTAALENRC
jgi:hypothetical protein